MIRLREEWINLMRTKRRLGLRRKLTFSKKLLYRLPVVAFFSLLIFSFIALLAFAYVAKDLPSPNKIVRKDGFATRIYDRNGVLLYDVFKDAKRTPVAFDQIPKDLKLATIAIEDKEFYSHSGFSVRGIARAIFNIIVRHRLEGGSTLTQQLVKNVLLTSERTLGRKFKEFILALQIERKYTKDEILQMYLNEAPYGGNAWGVEAASEQYFGKSVSQLGLSESAILAGLPQRPSVYSPFRGDVWKERTKAVLRRMKEEGFIDQEREEKALSQLDSVALNKESGLLKAPHFVMFVKRLLTERYGEEMTEQGGLKITTTLDVQLQEELEKIVKEEIDKSKTLNITNGASVIIEPETGQILAMVGSKDYSNDDIKGKFDVITQGLRQPGSAIKPVTYAAGFRKGYTAATLLMDVETVFPVVGQPNYTPVNYDGKYYGPLQVRYALGNSINVPAVKMLAMVGLPQVLKMAEDMGISTLAPSKENLSRLGLSVTLGGGEIKPLELAIAYCAFANGGFKKQPVSILKIENRDGKKMWEYKDEGSEEVLSKGEAFLVSDILSDNSARLITFGERNGLIVSNREVAVKTGTTNDKRDNWAIGWTPNILVLSWVGNNDNSPMKQVASGVSGATPIWRRAITVAIEMYGYREFQVPGDVVTMEIDSTSGYRAHDGYPARLEYFIKGTELSGDDPVHTKLKICQSSGKLATPPQVASGAYEEKEFFTFKEEDFVSTDGKNRWQEGILKWISGHDDPRYHPPSDYCEEGGVIEVAIDSPIHESTVSNDFPVVVKAKGLKRIIEVKVFINNEQRKTFTEKPYEIDLNLTNGTYTVKAVAKDEDGKTAEREAKIGVNLPWNWQPSPTPTLAPIPTPTLVPTLAPTP